MRRLQIRRSMVQMGMVTVTLAVAVADVMVQREHGTVNVLVLFAGTRTERRCGWSQHSVDIFDGIVSSL